MFAKVSSNGNSTTAWRVSARKLASGCAHCWRWDPPTAGVMVSSHFLRVGQLESDRRLDSTGSRYHQE